MYLTVHLIDTSLHVSWLFLVSFSEEIEYVMMCVDANQDGKVDFNEFTGRFHDPAKDIGFNVAVLLTNLSEHIPNDPRLVETEVTHVSSYRNIYSIIILF